MTDEPKSVYNTKWHLTLTGPYAGQMFCGGNKAKSVENGDMHMHYEYSADWPTKAAATLCPDCKAELDACNAEYETERNLS